MVAKVSQWIMGIVGVVLLGVLADIVLGEGRTKKQIKGVFGLITLLVIISPIAGVLKEGWGGFESVFGGSITADETYLDTVNKSQLSELQSALERHLKAQGYDNTRVSFSTVGQSLSLIYIDLSGTGSEMWQEYAAVKQIAAKFLNFEEGAVIVYG